jgi:ribosome-binding factor A
MLEYKRTDRVGQLIREIISSILLEETNDPRVHFVSITHVDVSEDFKHAKVFFSALGSEEEKEDASKGLKSAQGYIQRKLGRKLRLRYTPEIAFKMDDSIERGIHIYELLGEIKNKEKQNHGEQS